jgi:hypothetical protein
MNRDNNRLMLELEQMRSTINRNTIGPEIRQLTQAQLAPIVTVVAEARAAYIKSVFELAEDGGVPSSKQISTLCEHRIAFT